MLLTTTACRSIQIDAALRSPSELTATATSRSRSELGKLAFIQGGDVWIKALPDGSPRRLTTDGRNREPRWSPSGAWLAFRKDLGVTSHQQLWQVREDGTAARSVGVIRADADGQFAWAPGSAALADTLAFVENGGLILVPADGTNRRTLVPASPSQYSGVQALVWSLNGQRIAFQRTDTTPRLDLSGVTAHPTMAEGIWRIQSDGSGSSQIYANSRVTLVRLSLQGWSPDGQQVLFWQYPTSASLAADDVALKAVAATGGLPLTVAQPMIKRPDFLAWSPDGQQLAFVEGAGRWTWGTKAISVTSLSGTQRVLTASNRAALDPAWSPDGKLIAFVSQTAHPNDAGSDVARLTAGRAIWLMRADGSDQRALTTSTTARDERPRWSADVRFILFARLENQRAQLWPMRADGSQQHLVVDELTPSPLAWDDYGSIPWSRAYDWWRGSPKRS